MTTPATALMRREKFWSISVRSGIDVAEDDAVERVVQHHVEALERAHRRDLGHAEARAVVHQAHVPADLGLDGVERRAHQAEVLLGGERAAEARRRRAVGHVVEQRLRRRADDRDALGAGARGRLGLDDVLVDVPGGDDRIEQRELFRRGARPAGARARPGWPGSARASPRRGAPPSRASAGARTAPRPSSGRRAGRPRRKRSAPPAPGRCPSRAPLPAPACRTRWRDSTTRLGIGTSSRVHAVDPEQAQDRALGRDRRVLPGLLANPVGDLARQAPAAFDLFGGEAELVRHGVRKYSRGLSRAGLTRGQPRGRARELPGNSRRERLEDARGRQRRPGRRGRVRGQGQQPRRPPHGEADARSRSARRCAGERKTAVKSSATSVSPGCGAWSASQTSVRAPSTPRTRVPAGASGEPDELDGGARGREDRFERLAGRHADRQHDAVGDAHAGEARAGRSRRRAARARRRRTRAPRPSPPSATPSRDRSSRSRLRPRRGGPRRGRSASRRAASRPATPRNDAEP